MDFIRPRYCWERHQLNFPEDADDSSFMLPVLFFGDLEREWVPLSRISEFSKRSPLFRASDDEFTQAYRMMKSEPFVEAQVDGHARAAGWSRNLENSMPSQWRVALRRVRRKVSGWWSGAERELSTALIKGVANDLLIFLFDFLFCRAKLRYIFFISNRIF